MHPELTDLRETVGIQGEVTGPAGWQLHDPEGGGQLFDAGYQPGGSIQMRPTIEYPPYGNSNSGRFCADTDPLWTWTMTAP
jgi:hypothetical protein